MQYTNYKYQNLEKNRKATLFLLNNRTEYAMLRFNYKNSCKRAMNRLSTKQLVAKIRTFDLRTTKATSAYVGWLDQVSVA